MVYKKRVKVFTLAFACFFIGYFVAKYQVGTVVLLLQNYEKEFSSFMNYPIKSQVFANSRLILRFTGLCISQSEDKILVAGYCDPNKKQVFSLSADGKLIFNNDGYCVSIRNNTSNKFENCRDALPFSLVNNSYIQFTDRNHVVKCLTPVPQRNFTEPGDELKFSECHEIFSRVQLIEEISFQVDRKALKYPLTNFDRESCNMPCCHLNRKLPSVKLISPFTTPSCVRYDECVTVVTKTARRPLLVIRMAQSIRDIKGYDLPIIVFDDGPDDYDEDIHRKIAQFPLLEYHVGDDDDLGISLGRNLAVSMVKTKYSLFVDDDNIFINGTIFEKAVEILESTDASVIGGVYSNQREFSGFMEFSGDESFAKLTLYPGSCTKENITIPNYPSCVSCDLTANIFLAHTTDIREVGGWSPELKMKEHKDIFLKLKGSGKKVVYCIDFEVINKKETDNLNFSPTEYYDKRNGRIQIMEHLFCNRWNIAAQNKDMKFNQQKNT